MDSSKLQLLLNKQSLTHDKKSSPNARLQTLKDSTQPQDCLEPDFSTNSEKLSPLSATNATNSMCNNSFKNSLFTAIEDLFNIVSKEQMATTNTNKTSFWH